MESVQTIWPALHHSRLPAIELSSLINQLTDVQMEEPKNPNFVVNSGLDLIRIEHSRPFNWNLHPCLESFAILPTNGLKEQDGYRFGPTFITVI